MGALLRSSQPGHVLLGYSRSMGRLRSRHPITFWALTTLGILFLFVEAVVLVRDVGTRCEGCVDEGVGLFYVALLFAWIAVPVGFGGLVADAVRHRVRTGSWRTTSSVPPPRPDPS